MESLSRRVGPSSLERAGCPHGTIEPRQHALVAARSVNAPAVLGAPPGPWRESPADIDLEDAPADPSGSEKADGEEQTDAELIESVRKGGVRAYGELYVRHVSAAYNLARQLARSSADADDLVAEAFAKMLAALRAGNGPDEAFRAYLLTALRHTAYDRTRGERRIELADEVAEVSGVRVESVSEPFTDTAVAGLEGWHATRAYCRLPKRWQRVLWHTAIEGHNPTETAPVLGLSPNGVSALAYRAREGLCSSYLQVQLGESGIPQRCQPTVAKLGKWTRAGLCLSERRQVEEHLGFCAKCRVRVKELAANNPRLVRQWDNPALRQAAPSSSRAG